MWGIQLKIIVSDLFSYQFGLSVDESMARDIWNCDI
jgi:hypothetical protein